jgi:hypothetical protein
MELELSPGGCFADLSMRDLFFALVGVLHADPFRFINDDEIHVLMKEVFGTLTSSELKRYTSASEEFASLHARNARSPTPASVAYTMPLAIACSELASIKSQFYRRGVQDSRWKLLITSSWSSLQTTLLWWLSPLGL